MPQNSKKFVNIREIPHVLSVAEKGKVGHSLVQVKSGLESAIYVALLRKVLSRVIQNGK